MAQQRDGRKSSFVRYYDYNDTLKKEVVKSTCRALICGQAFVVKHCTDRPSDHSQAKLSAELLHDMLGYRADGRMFEIHGMPRSYMVFSHKQLNFGSLKTLCSVSPTQSCLKHLVIWPTFWRILQPTTRSNAYLICLRVMGMFL